VEAPKKAVKTKNLKKAVAKVVKDKVPADTASI
jgi:hypothetical protein